MLSDLIGLSVGLEHALPWYPPICQSTKSDEKPLDITYFPASVIRATANAQQSSDTYLQSLLINYVNQGKVTEAEIGQRIITAIQKASIYISILTKIYNEQILCFFRKPVLVGCWQPWLAYIGAFAPTQEILSTV